MHLLSLKLLSILLILFTVIIAGWYPFKRHLQGFKGRKFTGSEALAAGIFLGAAIMHMLPDAQIGFVTHHIQYPFAFLIAGISFLTLLLMEHVARENYQDIQMHRIACPLLATFILSVHSLLAGIVLGLAVSFALTVIILIAILGHKWAASFALAIELGDSCFPLKWNIILFGFFAVMTPLGVLIGMLFLHKGVTDQSLAVPIFNALAGGSFLYLGTLHGLDRASILHGCCDLKHYSLVVIGFLLMAVIAMA